MDPLGILADDLTGACDCAAPFAERGARVAVRLLPDGPAPRPGPWDVLVVNTDSRNRPAAEARARVRRGALALRQAGWPLGFKKIDSTLRGQLGAEIEELLALGVARAWVAPAFPQLGRTVEAGRLLLRGTPLEATELRGDGLAPLAAGKIEAAFGPACEPIGHLALATLDQGTPTVANQVRLDRMRDCRVIVCDATEPRHLRVVARLLRDREIAEPRELLVGSAGLSRELAAVLIPDPAPASAASPAAAPEPGTAHPCTGPVLVIAGSRQQATQAQLDALAQAPGVVQVALDPGRLDGDDAAWLAEAEAAWRRVQGSGAAALVLAVLQDAAKAAPDPAALAARAQRILAALGGLTARIVAALAPRGLVLTGGDVAWAALRALDAAQLEIEGEVLPGVARARIGDGPHAGLPVVTKAGGFGDAQALVAVLHALPA